MGVDQPECGAGRSSPAKWSNTNTGEKNSETFDRRDVGCKLVVLKMHNAANEYLGLTERAENGAPRACANWTGPSSGQ